jgi:hypothetical protein
VPIPLLLVDVGSVNASIAVARKRAKKSLMFANANGRLGNNWATNTIAIGQPILSLGNNTTYLLLSLIPCSSMNEYEQERQLAKKMNVTCWREV